MIKKILTMALVSAAVVGLTIYEVCAIMTHEYERQMEIATGAEAEIERGLNMVQVAVATEDTELYEQNIESVRAAKEEIEPLSLVQREYAE